MHILDAETFLIFRITIRPEKHLAKSFLYLKNPGFFSAQKLVHNRRKAGQKNPFLCKALHPTWIAGVKL
jgi:hypothetical protein